MLITLYGINNIGKSTLSRRLVERLKTEGYRVEYVKYPVYDIEPTGPFLNQFIRSGGAQSVSEEELQMWFTLNRYQFQPRLQEWLSEGKIVVAEDYVGTGIAWGVVKGADRDWLESMNRHLVKEDLAVLLDGERFKSAMEEGHIHEANEDFMLRSRQVHLDLGERYGWEKIEVVEGIDRMEERVWERVRLHLPEKTD